MFGEKRGRGPVKEKAVWGSEIRDTGHVVVVGGSSLHAIPWAVSE